MKSNRKLKNLLIAPKIQIGYSIFAVVPIFLGIGAQTILILQKIGTLDHSKTEDLAGKLDLIRFSIISFTGTVLIVGTITFLLNIFITHRVFGALYGLEKYFRDLIDKKEHAPLTSRELDVTESLVATINEYLEKNKHTPA